MTWKEVNIATCATAAGLQIVVGNGTSIGADTIAVPTASAGVDVVVVAAAGNDADVGAGVI